MVWAALNLEDGGERAWHGLATPSEGPPLAHNSPRETTSDDDDSRHYGSVMGRGLGEGLSGDEIG